MARDTGGAGSWRGDGGPTRRRPRYLWKPGTDAGRGRDRLARYGLLAAAFLCIATFVYLLFLLTRPPRPCFVAVATRPEDDALRLDTPLDMLGWRSAERFLEGAARWSRKGLGRAAGHVVPGPARLSADRAELREWVRGFRPYDPVVMYLGVHCSSSDWYGPSPDKDGPGPVEPVLHVGGGQRLPVRWLLEEITASLPNKRVVLLLDPGRLRPDPVYGHVKDDFTERLKAVFQDLPKNDGSKLVVICGADAGQRGGESEELGATAFAHAVIRTLDEPSGKTDVRTAAELFTEVTDRLRVWSANNRVEAQTPLLLPPGDEGVKRAAAIRLAVRPEAAPPVWEPVALPPPEARVEWRERWETRARLADQAPHPAAYVPRLWRRYQELLLRYEAAVRAGRPAVVKRLADAARAAEVDLTRPLGLVFRPFAGGPDDPLPPSFKQALAFQAVTNPNAPDPTAALWDLSKDPSDVLPAAAGSPDGRPSERHLAAMVQRYYRSVLTPTEAPPASWKDAIELRVRADRAALGLPAPGGRLIGVSGWSGPAAALSERVWPFVREPVAAADVLRRDAEDRLFGPDVPGITFTTLARRYEAATDRAAAVRFAFHVRDAVLADLPYLGRWFVSSGTEAGAVLQLWERVHGLEAMLRNTPDPDALADAAGDVWTRFGSLRDTFDAAVREQSGAALQKTRPPKEDLLATPLLRPDDRERLLTASQKIAFDLLTKPSGPTAAATGPGVPGGPSAAAIQARALLAVAELGLSPADPNPTAVAARVAAVYRDLSPHRTDERASRLAVAFGADDKPWEEPAAANARKQWGELLSGLAARAVADHWYDENPGRGGAPYHQRVARLYRADAAQLLGKPPVEEPFADPLAVTPAGDGGPLRWTSELRRTLDFGLRVPATMPPGHAVVLRTLGGSPAVRYDPKGSGPARSLLPLKPEREAISFALAAASEDETTTTATATAGVYFRGQYPTATRPIAITRRPELILTDPGPTSADAAVAVRADPAQPLPPVVVLLDYSGSMKEGLNGFKLPGPDDAWKDGPSKFNLALRRLEAVLAELPKGTRLRVRLFSAKDLPDEDAVVYPAPGEPAVVDWRGADGARLKDLMARLRRYEPSGTTPLIQSIVMAARNDFPERADGPKTLVVLTDGADDSGRPGVPKEERDALRGELKNALTTTGVKLVVVQFALNDADRAVSKELFADLPNLDVPGKVVSADDADELRLKLIAALWPKLVLSEGGPSGLGRYPPDGWPARPPYAPRGATDLEGDLDPNTLLWSPPFVPGSYSARVAGYPARGFPKLALAPGDFLPLSLTHEGDGFALRRELHADAFGRALKAFRADGGWVLSVPTTGVEDGRERAAFGAVALVERVPPHLRPRTEIETEDPVRHIVPDALWWHVAPAGADPPAGTPVGWAETKTVVSRLYGYPAPAWDLRVEGWPRTPGVGFELATVRLWVPVIDPTSVLLPRVMLPRPGSEEIVPFDGRSFRVTVEQQVFAGSREPVKCLVVRTEYPAGAPVQLRLAVAAPGTRTEHRYFRNANGYTAVFGPGAVPEGANSVQFQLVRVGEFTAQPDAVIRLTPPPPPPGRRPDGYRPVPSQVDR
jgi:hypothetical protein